MSIIEDAYTIVITGRKDAGKTAFGAYLLEQYHKKYQWRVCIMPFKRIPDKLLPKWVNQDDPMSPTLIEGTAYFLDDFHLVHHARTGYRQEQINFNKISSIARHLEIKFIISTQITRQLDVSNVWDIDVHFLRQPALGHVKAERQDVKARTRTAYNFFRKEMGAGVDPKTLAYYFTMETEGAIRDIPLPFEGEDVTWSEDLSKYLKGVQRRRTRSIRAAS